MADIFISYSRKDKDFVRRLDEALKSRGREAWVDWEDIRPTEEWMHAIYAAIEGADTFVFVLTPDSVASVVCGREIAHAAEHNKRMVPIVARDMSPETVPEALAKLNWIFFRETDDFEKAIDILIGALDTDLDWVHAHTRLLTRAIEWESNGKNTSLVLRGDDLRSAERWLAEAGAEKGRQPTALQTEYIIASRKAATRRQRITLGAVSFGLVVAIVLAIVAWSQRTEAVANANEADRQKQEAMKQEAKATAGRNRADGVINFVQNNLTEKLLPEKLRPSGRLDLMQDVGAAVDGYYSAMKKAEGESVDTLTGKAWVLVFQGLIDASKGRLDDALPKHRSAVALADKAQRLDPGSNKALEHLAGAHFVLGAVLASHGDAEEASHESQEAQQIYEKLAARDPSNARVQTKLAVSYDTEANRLYEQKQFDAALSKYRMAYVIREKLAAEAPNDSKRLSDLASSHDHIGKVLLQQQQFDPALTEFGASQEIIRKLTLIDPHNADWQRDLAFTYNSIGEVLQAQDHIATALDEFHKYSQTMENVAASDPANTVWQREAADARQPIAELLVKQKQFKEALSEFRKYYSAMNKLAAGDPTNAAVQVVAAAACSQVALVNMMLKDRGDYDEAAHMAQQGLALLAGVEKRGTPPPQSVEIRKKLEWLKRSLPNPAP
jgi:tetratricopeptide (TPR) repeat protein